MYRRSHHHAEWDSFMMRALSRMAQSAHEPYRRSLRCCMMSPMNQSGILRNMLCCKEVYTAHIICISIEHVICSSIVHVICSSTARVICSSTARVICSSPCKRAGRPLGQTVRECVPCGGTATRGQKNTAPAPAHSCRRGGSNGVRHV